LTAPDRDATRRPASDQDLRAELQRLTVPPEGADLGWLDHQTTEQEADSVVKSIKLIIS
jgi:hypothetical protein